MPDPIIQATDQRTYDPATQKILDRLSADGTYTHIRVLPDGVICGVGPLIFTTALYIDLDLYGWGERYCYPDEAQAIKALHALKHGDDLPARGYVATRNA